MRLEVHLHSLKDSCPLGIEVELGRVSLTQSVSGPVSSLLFSARKSPSLNDEASRSQSLLHFCGYFITCSQELLQ